MKAEDGAESVKITAQKHGPALLLLATLGALATACVGSGDLSAGFSGQIVGDDGMPLGPGLVLVEKGPVHAGAYQTGGLIDDQGRFSIDLPSGGTWGIHLFQSEYQYLPLEITIEAHQQVQLTSMMVAWGVWLDLTGLPTWPDQPIDSRLIRMPVDDIKTDNPVFGNVQIHYIGDEFVEITADVSDPTDDLSRMELIYDPTTGGGYAMNPPSAPDAQGHFPQGQYRLLIPRDPAHIPGKSKLYFVVSDNMCNNPPIQIHTLPAQ